MIRWVICGSWLCLCGASGARSTSLVAGGQQNTSANLAAGSATGNFVDVGGAKIWYEECGDDSGGANVVLLHDGLVHSVTWDAVWVPLCAKYHVVRYDRRGYGRSESAATVFDPVEDLNKVMRQVHMERGIIVGCSSGGGLALDFAVAHPEMVTGLFLIGPVVHGVASSDYFDTRNAKNSAPMDHGDLKGAAKNWSEDRFIIGGNDPPSRKKVYDALVASPQDLKVGGEFEIRPSPPTSHRLSEIRVATLALAGEYDIADVFAYCGAIEAAVPLGSFEVVKDAGHLIQIQRPAELVKNFSQFVSLVERREISLTDSQLREFAGEYRVGPRIGTVSLRDHRLVMEIPGDPYYWLFPGSETKFFLRTENTELEFVMNGQTVAEMIVHNSDGTVNHCPRVDTVAPH
jgi:pimeloyl-ACP methyl ester carboxylesterase